MRTQLVIKIFFINLIYSSYYHKDNNSNLDTIYIYCSGESASESIEKKELDQSCPFDFGTTKSSTTYSAFALKVLVRGYHSEIHFLLVRIAFSWRTPPQLAVNGFARSED